MAEKVKTFALCSNQRKLLARMTDTQKAMLIDSLFAYNDEEDVKIDDPLVDTVFVVIVEAIERMREFSEQKKQNGSNGGRPPKNANQNKPSETKNNQDETKNNQNKPSETPISISIPLSVSNNGELTSPDGEVRKRPAAKKKIPFVAPTIEEVQAYCDERMNGIDAQRFHDYYATRGWHLKDGQKVQDWKACLRTWEHNESSRRQGAAGSVIQMPHQLSDAERRQMHNDEVCRQVIADIEAGKGGPWA